MIKNNPLNDIIECDIDISNPSSNNVAFENILIIVPGPQGSGKKKMEKVTAISKADELLDYGFVVSETAYVAASVAFSQNPSPSKIFVCIRKTDSELSDTGTYEDIKKTLARANDEAEFYGVHLTEFKTTNDIAAAADWTEAQEKLLCFEYADVENCPLKNTQYFRTFGMYSGHAEGYKTEEQPKENAFAALAEMAKCFCYEPGTETWHLKELTTIVPSAIGAEEKKILNEKHINSFRRYCGSNVTFGGKVLSGEWIDVIRFRDWLKAEIQENVFKAMKGNRKVPFTDNGIGLIEGAMKKALQKGQDIGGIAPTEYDEDLNAIPGYTVYVPAASSLSEAERKSRKLTGCKWSARLSGAIHATEISGNLTF